MAKYAEFGSWIRACYGTPLATASLAPGQASLTLPLPAGSTFDRISLEEVQTLGQFVFSYTVTAQTAAGWVVFSQGVSIGSKRIDVLPSPAVVAKGPVTAPAVKVTINSAFAPGHNGVTLKVFSGAGCATA